MRDTGMYIEKHAVAAGISTQELLMEPAKPKEVLVAEALAAEEVLAAMRDKEALLMDSA